MFFIGDTHGNNDVIKYNMLMKKLTDQVFIHVGDYGIGFMSDEKQLAIDIKFNEFLQKQNNIIHVFRGNHDNPKFFNGDYMFSNLKFHKDYTILEIENKKILGIGGAISIDRVPRMRYENTWWADEVFYLDVEFLNNVRDIDILVTHSAPSECPPRNNNGFPPIVTQFASSDISLLRDLNVEREELSQALFIILKNNKLSHHFYGHFHTHIKSKIGDLNHYCLDIGEHYQLVDYTLYESEMNEKYSK